MKVLVVYYSLYGHSDWMAQAVAEGVGRSPVSRLSYGKCRKRCLTKSWVKMGAVEARKQQADVPIASLDDLVNADALSSEPRHASATCAARCVSFWIPPASSG